MCVAGVLVWRAAAMRHPSHPKCRTHILVTTITGYIQGIPFFSPLYVQNNEFHFYSSVRISWARQPETVFEAQMALPYFPVDMSAMNAKRKFKEVDGGFVYVGEHKITAGG